MVSQAAKNKRDGSAYESALVNYFRERSYEADRLRLSGKEDEGDLVVRHNGKPFLIIEAKAGKNIRPRYWYDDEAVPEARNYCKRRGLPGITPVLAMKSHNKSIGSSLITISLDDLAQLLEGGTPA